jgi:hypothetical protein
MLEVDLVDIPATLSDSFKRHSLQSLHAGEIGLDQGDLPTRSVGSGRGHSFIIRFAPLVLRDKAAQYRFVIWYWRML